MNEALKDPKIIARMSDLGGVPLAGTPEDFGKIVVAETEKWKKVVEFAGVSVD
jgi:tripartite-type tricarboxylate transporter receptor subunit TctC